MKTKIKEFLMALAILVVGYMVICLAAFMSN